MLICLYLWSALFNLFQVLWVLSSVQGDFRVAIWDKLFYKWSF